MAVTINGTTGVLVGTGSITFPDSSTQNTAATGFGFKNKLINGAMMIDQRNAGASNTPTNNYTLDRWDALGTQTSKFTVQQNAGSVTPPAGFSKYLGVTSSSSYSITSTDLFRIGQAVEGLNMVDFAWGTANASNVTLSFWVRSSLTGSFGGAIQNAANTRAFPFLYTISAANTWEYKTVAITGETSGAWNTDTSLGLRLQFSLGSGSTKRQTAGAWYAGDANSATGETSVVGTSGATFYITGVQLEKCSTATSFDYRPYGTELALCQRYYQKSFPVNTAPANGVEDTRHISINSGSALRTESIPFKVNMRSSPSLTFFASSAANTAGNWAYYTSGWNTFSPSADSVNEFAFNVVGPNSSGLVTGSWTATSEL